MKAESLLSKTCRFIPVWGGFPSSSLPGRLNPTGPQRTHTDSRSCRQLGPNPGEGPDRLKGSWARWSPVNPISLALGAVRRAGALGEKADSLTEPEEQS